MWLVSGCNHLHDISLAHKMFRGVADKMASNSKLKAIKIPYVLSKYGPALPQWLDQ